MTEPESPGQHPDHPAGIPPCLKTRLLSETQDIRSTTVPPSPPAAPTVRTGSPCRDLPETCSSNHLLDTVEVET